MKKKMLFMAAIAGLISLGSCVKDDVSGSVEAVRQAKANELNARANDFNATADHTKAITSADVAYRTAEAAEKQADAEIRKMQQQLEAASLEANIAQTIAGYNATTAAANRAQAADLRALATDESADVAAAVAAYQLAFGNYTNAQKAVIAANLRYETAKNDAENAAEIKANAIRGFEKAIEEDEAMIAALKEVEVSGVTIEEAKAAIAKLEAEILQAQADFGGSAEVAALIDAGKALADAKKAFSAAEGSSFGALNNMVAKAFGIDVAPGGYWTQAADGSWSANTSIVRVGAGQQYYTAPSVLSAPVAAPWGAYSDYFEVVGDPKQIKANPAAPFFDYDTYGFEYTADADGDGINDSAPALVGNGNSVLNGSNFEVKTYRVNEHTKSAAEDYYKNLPTNTKNALANAKKALSNLQAKMGTEKDTKDTEYAKGKKTDYALLALANENLDKAKKAVDTANANTTGKPKAVKDAYEALLSEVQKKTFDGDKWIAAVVTLAEAVEDAYGTPNYEPNLKKYTWPTDQNAAVEYLFGVTGKTKAQLDDEAEVKELFDDSKAGKIVKTWAAGTAATDKNAKNIDKVTEVINRSSAKDAKKSVFVTLEEAKDALGDSSDTSTTTKKSDGVTPTAYAAVAAANETIFGQFDKDNKLIKDGDVQKIAAQKDAIATKFEPEAAEAAATKAAFDKAAAAADVKTYDKAASVLADAAGKYNTAAGGVLGLLGEIGDMGDEIAAYQVVIKKQDIETQIIALEKDIADQKQSIANWDQTTATNPDAIIAQAEADLVDAIADLATATADLQAAQTALEALVGELEIDLDLDDDDEPTEEPSEGEGDGEAPAETPEVVAPAEGE